MTASTIAAEPRSLSSSALRVRRHRERRRRRLRLLTVPLPERVIDAAAERGLIKPEDRAEPWTVVEACYASLLSDIRSALDRQAPLLRGLRGGQPVRALAASSGGGDARPTQQPRAPSRSPEPGSILHRLIPSMRVGYFARQRLILVQTGPGMLRRGSPRAMARHDDRGLIGRLAMCDPEPEGSSPSAPLISATVRCNDPDRRSCTKFP
jgi:hypothetical protein